MGARAPNSLTLARTCSAVGVFVMLVYVALVPGALFGWLLLARRRGWLQTTRAW